MGDVGTAQHVADMLSLSRAWVYELAQRGEIPSFKIGASVRFDLDEVRAWLEEHRQGHPIAS